MNATEVDRVFRTAKSPVSLNILAIVAVAAIKYTRFSDPIPRFPSVSGRL